jgi:hypothetical protein
MQLRLHFYNTRLGKQLHRLPNIGVKIITDVGQMKLARPTGSKSLEDALCLQATHANEDVDHSAVSQTDIVS